MGAFICSKGQERTGGEVVHPGLLPPSPWKLEASAHASVQSQHQLWYTSTTETVNHAASTTAASSRMTRNTPSSTVAYHSRSTTRLPPLWHHRRWPCTWLRILRGEHNLSHGRRLYRTWAWPAPTFHFLTCLLPYASTHLCAQLCRLLCYSEQLAWCRDFVYF